MIRKLEKSDCGPLMDLLEAVRNFTAAELAIAAELIDIVLNRQEQEDYYAFIDEQESRVAGFVILGPVPATTGSWHMYWIAVHPDFQGKGVAQDLDRAAESFVGSKAGYWILAETSGQPSYQRTRAFYRKQGYRVLAQIPDYYKPADDLIIFGKRLQGGEPV